MSNPLLQKISNVRARIVRTIWTLGLSRTIFVFLATAMFLALIDWSFRIDDVGIRVVFTAALFVATGFVVWRYLLRPLRAQLSDIEIAAQIEQANAGFGNRLSSSVQFLNQPNDETVGSAELQQNVIQQSVKEVKDLDTSSVVQERPARRSFYSALAVVLLAAIAFFVSPVNVVTAAKRLTMPLANNPWPKQTVLQFVDDNGEPIKIDYRKPWKMAEGESLQLLIENTQGALPEDARIQFRLENKKQLFRRRIRPATVTGADGIRHDIGAATLSLANSLKFRAIGGDDSGTAWQSVNVVPVPVLKDLRLTVEPPAYTGHQNLEFSATGPLTVLAGSRVGIIANASKTISAATLFVGNENPIPIEVASGRSLNVKFDANEPGNRSWHIKMKDTDGFEGRNARRYELRVQADQVPNVYIDRPADDLQVTADARVFVSVVVKDDLGVKAVRLQFRNGPDDAPLQAIELKATDDRPTQTTVDYDWNLAELNPSLRDRIVFYAEATDDFDLAEAHVGQSEPRTLIVVSATEKKAGLAGRQAELMSDLERIADLQTRTKDQTRELQLQMETAGSLKDEDIALLKRVEVEQRRITSRLFEPTGGLNAQTQQLLDEFDANNLQDADSRQQLSGLHEELNRINQDMTPVIENQITAARKSIQAESNRTNDDQESSADKSTVAPDDAKRAVAEVTEKQQEVVDTLQQSLDQLSTWKQRFDIAGDLNQVITQQEQLNQETAQAAKDTLTRSLNQLTPQQKADIARLAERQRQQARQLGDVSRAIQQAAEQLTGPLKESVAATAEQLKEQATETEMESAADRIEANQLGGATQQQADILQQLNQASEALNNQSIDDSQTRVEKLKQQEAELGELRDEQQRLIQELQQLNSRDEKPTENVMDRVASQQQKIREQTQDQADQLRKNSARQASRTTERAAERMQQAEDSVESAKDQADSEQNANDESQDRSLENAEQFAQEALEDLEQALDETAEQRGRDEAELAKEKMYEMADALSAIVEQQAVIVSSTTELDQLREKTGRLSRSQSRSVLKLAETQRGLRDEVTLLAKSVTDSPVIRFTLQSAEGQMELAADLLAKRETGPPTLTAETLAKRRLEDLLAVLKDEQQNSSGNSEQPQQQDEQGDDQEEPQPEDNQDALSLMANLKLLRSLQLDLHERTVQLETQRRSNPKLDDAQQQQIDLIASDQAQITELAQELADKAEAAATGATGRESEVAPGSPIDKPDTSNAESTNPKDLKP